MDKKISETYIMETRKDRESDSFGDATYFKLRTDRKYVFAYNEKLEHFEITEVEATKGTLFADSSRYIKAFTENELIEYKAKIRADTIDECIDVLNNSIPLLDNMDVIFGFKCAVERLEQLKEQKNG